MSQQADITVFDGAATPVSHTLRGDGVQRAADGTIVMSWKESLAGVPDYAQVRVTMTKKRLPSGVFEVVVQGEVPVMESVSGQNSSGYTAAPKVAYTDTIKVRCLFHERGVVAGRRLVRQLVTNVLGNISTSVTPVTTGPAPELIDQLISVS